VRITYILHANDKSGYLQGLTLFLSYAILAAVLGMLQFGYNTGVINAPEVVCLRKVAALYVLNNFHTRTLL